MYQHIMLCTYCNKDASCGGLIDDKLACEDCLNKTYIANSLSSLTKRYLERIKEDK